jgi:hypothetical protein
MTFRRNPLIRGGGIRRRLVGTVLRSVSTRLLGGLMLLALLLTVLMACSPGTEQEPQHAGEDARQVPTPQETAATSKRVAPESILEGEATTTNSRLRWDYVALGDSLAAGRTGSIFPYVRPHS